MDRRNFFQRAALAVAGFIAARLGMTNPPSRWDAILWDPVYSGNNVLRIGFPPRITSTVGLGRPYTQADWFNDAEWLRAGNKL